VASHSLPLKTLTHSFTLQLTQLMQDSLGGNAKTVGATSNGVHGMDEGLI
jgi:hypothetical protein